MKRKKLTWNRQTIELIVVGIIILCGLSVLTVNWSTQATLSYDDGKLVYTGKVVNHRMNGHGLLTYANGDTYEGDFVNGVFEGQGVYTASVGWTYEGEFSNGQADGEGTLTALNGDVYKGTFKQGIYQE